VIKGQIFSQEDLYVDGQIEGTVELPGNRLTVGKSGKVQASIKAREVDALGAVNGNIVAGERIIIRKDANLVGDLKSASVSIEDGAYFKGSIDIVRPPPAKPAPAAPPPPPSPSAGRTVTPPTGPPPPGGGKPAP
jgi:cytoskeletal protein CcmA (bactofilin family)